MRTKSILLSAFFSFTLASASDVSSLSYPIAGSGQTKCYGDTKEITCPKPGAAFYGQDGHRTRNTPGYQFSSDGLTVYDKTTGLTWQRSPDINGDGSIAATDKLSYSQAQARPAVLNAARYGGFNDWRLPTIKELFSLINFNGTDVSPEATSTTGLTPFIDTKYFKFAYGQVEAGERVIDSQYASSTMYVYTPASLLFGVNFADGRIKGYGLTLHGRDKTFFVQCVRGNVGYGVNRFVDNGDSTITDASTGLMWTQNDSGSGMNWKDALAWVQSKNTEKHLRYSDWRMPTAKELQSIVDYTRSPDTSSSAAIDPMFKATQIKNEMSQADYPFYWTGTTHVVKGDSASGDNGSEGVYVAFGRATGYMDNVWSDVHGAGAQRSDPKSGNAADYLTGRGPQGDGIRILNYVRLVRTAIPNVGSTYPLAATGQVKAYDNSAEITGVVSGKPFWGQDAHYQRGDTMAFRDNGDGTTTDLNTGLMWQKTPASTSFGWQDASNSCKQLTLLGYNDWRLPTLKELFSVSDFGSGWPYINTTYFSLAGKTVSKDEQFWSANDYKIGTTHGGQASAFGVNHGTGHIKAYPAGAGGPMGNYARCVRGTEYGANQFVDNKDATITDTATGLMWTQDDSLKGMNWESALTYAQESRTGGYSDWRLPNVKELQSIVDYSRQTLPAIDPLFRSTGIVNEAGLADFAYYWTSTSAYMNPNAPGYYYAWYVAFGRAVDTTGADIHGAGAVRFDTKVQGGPAGEGGERYYNYVRLVRDATQPATTTTATLSLVSAASYDGTAVAPASIVSAFGSGMSSSTVTVKDSAGSTRTAEVLFAADKQVNFVMPEATAMGTATVSVLKAGQVAASGVVMVTKVAPAVFSSNASGKGAAAALAVRVVSGGAQSTSLTFQCGQTAGSCSAIPIDLGAATDQVLLSLFGTGMRGATGQATATVGGTAVTVAGPVAQGQYAGLDQVNLGPLPRTLAGRGDVEILLTVDGMKANAVTVNIK